MQHFHQLSDRLDAADRDDLARVVLDLARELGATEECANCSHELVQTSEFVERAGRLPRAPKDVSFLVQTITDSGVQTGSSRAGFCIECEGAWNRSVED